MWNGTAPSLKASPATTKTTPKTSTSRLIAGFVAICSNTRGIASVPVAPYIIDRP